MQPARHADQIIPSTLHTQHACNCTLLGASARRHTRACRGPNTRSPILFSHAIPHRCLPVPPSRTAARPAACRATSPPSLACCASTRTRSSYCSACSCPEPGGRGQEGGGARSARRGRPPTRDRSARPGRLAAEGGARVGRVRVRRLGRVRFGVVLPVPLQHLAVLAVHLQAELLVQVLPLLHEQLRRCEKV